jgi:hypothetical protein
MLVLRLVVAADLLCDGEKKSVDEYLDEEREMGGELE